MLNPNTLKNNAVDNTLEQKTEEWRHQISNSIRCFDQLPQNIKSHLNKREFELAADNFTFSVTPYYLSLIDANDINDPILKMALPSGNELKSTSNVCDDPICEQSHAVFPGFIRRYPDRVLLIVSGNCPVFCRHCTRRSMGRGKIVPISKNNFKKALHYLSQHEEIKEVIVSGGDPLLLEDENLFDILKQVSQLPSIDIIRLASRVPVTLPMRITAQLTKKIASFGTIYLSTHFNHPKELTKQAIEAISHFVEAGIVVNNQTVLLRGVNDDSKIIEELCRGLLRARIRPYYLFMCDLVSGTEHFRTSLEKGIEIMNYLRGRLSGIGIPLLIVDLPGGLGKVPVLPQYIVKQTDDSIIFRSPNDELVTYPKQINILLR